MRVCQNLMFDVRSWKLKFDFGVEVCSSKFETLDNRLTLTSEVQVCLKSLNFRVFE